MDKAGFEYYMFSIAFQFSKMITFSKIHEKLFKSRKTKLRFFMGKEGLEPSTLAGYASETYAYTSSATCP